MSFVVYSIKGGVGKTTLSVQISQMLEHTYVTNDSHSSAHNLMPEEKGFLVSIEEYEEIPYDDNVVYDFGGFKDTRINDIIKQAKSEKKALIVFNMIKPNTTLTKEIKSQLQEYNIKVSKNMLSDLVSFSRSVLVNGVEENHNAQKQIDNLTKEILMLSINI